FLRLVHILTSDLLRSGPISLRSVSRPHRPPRFFPTRRSSDLAYGSAAPWAGRRRDRHQPWRQAVPAQGQRSGTRRVSATSHAATDRKSTRLNSSHVKISYAVFCLKKKKACTVEIGVHQLREFG